MLFAAAANLCSFVDMDVCMMYRFGRMANNITHNSIMVYGTIIRYLYFANLYDSCQQVNDRTLVEDMFTVNLKQLQQPNPISL